MSTLFTGRPSIKMQEKEHLSPRIARRMRDFKPERVIRSIQDNRAWIKFYTEQTAEGILATYEKWERPMLRTQIYDQQRILIEKGLEKSLKSMEEQYDQYVKVD